MNKKLEIFKSILKKVYNKKYKDADYDKSGLHVIYEPVIMEAMLNAYNLGKYNT